MRQWQQRFASLERWLLPAECLLCQAPLGSTGEEPLACGVCRSRWPALPAPWCPTCGQPSEAGLPCRICAEWPPGLLRVRSAVWLSGGAREAAHKLKYGGWPRIAWSMAPAMVVAARGLVSLTGALSLCPVPLGVRRLRARGYNQAGALASALGAALGVPVQHEALRRVRETGTQTTRTPAERRANVEGAFRAQQVRGREVLIIDDVFTTGATLLACAEALRRAGAASVAAVTFARAAEPVLHLEENRTWR